VGVQLLLDEFGRDVASSPVHPELNLESHVALNGRDELIRVDHFYLAARFDVFRPDLTGTLLLKGYSLRLVRVHAQFNLLEVQDDVRDILVDTRDAGEFVENSQRFVELHTDNGCTVDRRQQNPPERVPDGDAEAALQRLCIEAGIGVRIRVFHYLQLGRFYDLFPVLLNHPSPVPLKSYFE
jgi:hypothetical protein